MKKMLLLFIGLLSISMSVFSKSVGVVLFTVNQVSTETRTLTRGSTIYTGETIITGAGASAQIKYLNGTLVTIHPNSRYQTLDYEPNNQLSIKSKLSPGALEYASSGKKKSILQTPVVALAIEGTQFKVIATSNNTFLEVIEGLVVGNGVRVGPNQKFSSGAFDKKGHFTPGRIPWDAIVNEKISTLDLDLFDTNTTMEINEILPKLIEDNAMNSPLDVLIPLFSIAQLQIAIP